MGLARLYLLGTGFRCLSTVCRCRNGIPLCRRWPLRMIYVINGRTLLGGRCVGTPIAIDQPVGRCRKNMCLCHSRQMDSAQLAPKNFPGIRMNFETALKRTANRIGDDTNGARRSGAAIRLRWFHLPDLAINSLASAPRPFFFVGSMLSKTIYVVRTKRLV